MKIKIKYVFVILLCCVCFITANLILLAGALSEPMAVQAVQSEEESVASNGACGTDATWEYSGDTNTLTISGSGAMTSYAYGTAPWYSYAGEINKVVVSDEITYISAGAFYGCYSLQEITLPFVGDSRNISETVQATKFSTWQGGSGNLFGYIFGGAVKQGTNSSTSDWIYQGQEAFIGPNPYFHKYYDGYYIPASLRKVTITDAEGISANAFYGCTMIEELNLNDSITTIYDNAFYNCTALNVFELPRGLSSLGSGVMQNCDSLRYIELPSQIINIPTYIFYDCDNLLNVKIHDDITTIDEYAFYSCDSLKNVELPEKLETIGRYAFSECESFTEIVIPNSVINIDGFAFA